MHELIGLNVEIADSVNKQLIGFHGKVVDETKFMIILQTENGIKKIPKENSKWKFIFGNAEFVINGNSLAKRPEERLR